MLHESEVKPAKKGFFQIAHNALSIKDDKVYWSACALLSHFVEQEPGRLLRVVRHFSEAATSEQRAALGKCILEHLLEWHFDLAIHAIRAETDQSVRFAMVDVLSRCWPFGEAARSHKWKSVEALIGEYPELAKSRASVEFLLDCQ
jgi:hypothetical protein